jgi:hypothetical protein
MQTLRLTLSAFLLLAMQGEAEADSLFTVGNSLSLNHKPNLVEELTGYACDWHYRSSKSMEYIEAHPLEVSHPDSTAWGSVLPATQYTNIAFQPNWATSATIAGEVAAIENIAGPVLALYPNTRLYIFDTWHWYSVATAGGTWADYWEGGVTGAAMDQRRAYFDLVQSNVEVSLGVTFSRIRTGDVMSVLETGYGYDLSTEIYAVDNIHLGPVGQYMAYSTMMYVVYGIVDPDPGTGNFDGLTSQHRSDFAEAIQQVYTTLSISDRDRDGDVDGADLLAWQRDDGTAVGLVNWQNDFGTGSSAITKSGVVPEPNALALVLMTSAAWAVLGRWQRETSTHFRSLA